MRKTNSKTQLKTNTFRDSKGQEKQVRLWRMEEIQNGSKVQKWCIGKYKYSLTDLLGYGFSSNVYKATLLHNPKQRFALKVINLDKFKDDSLELLEDQIQIIRNLNHPNIIKCLDVYKTQRNYFLVTEYCPHGDLQELIKLQKKVAEDRALAIMKQIIDGYKYMMSKNVIHRDLKPANIMRFGNKWKIGDFGFARYCPQQFVLQKITLGTPLYMALQCLQCSKYSYKSDVFSIGIIFYELLTGQTPWPGRNQKQLENFMKKKPIVDIPETMCPQIKDFIKKTISTDYYSRMNKDQFKKLDFQHIDMSKLTQMRVKGMSPAHKALSKSVKKQNLTLTPIKNQNLPHNRLRNIGALTPRVGPTYQKEQVKTRSNNNTNKYSRVTAQKQKSLTNESVFNEYFSSYKQSIKSQYSDFVHPNLQKNYQKNTQMIRNEIQFCKMIINMIQNIHYFMLDKKQRVYLILLLYGYATRNLKMLSNIQSRTNVLRLENWDTFRNSDRYSKNVLQVMQVYEKYHAWYLQYIKNIQSSTLKKVKESFPELFQQNALNFRFYGKFFVQLKQFILLHIMKPTKQVQKQDRKAYANGISQLYEIIYIIENRTKKQNQIKGIGLKQKPQIIHNYSTRSSIASRTSQTDNNFQKQMKKMSQFLGAAYKNI